MPVVPTHPLAPSHSDLVTRSLTVPAVRSGDSLFTQGLLPHFTPKSQDMESTTDRPVADCH